MTLTETLAADTTESTGSDDFTEAEQALINHLSEHSQRAARLAARVATWIETDGEHALRGIAKAVPPGQLLSLVLRLNPRHGQVFQEYRKANRKERPQAIAALRRDMTAWNWELNGQTVTFEAESGRLANGNHRARGLAGAPDGTQIQQLCVFGTEDDKTVDTGLGRTLADALNREGMTHAGAIAALTSRMEGLDHGAPVMSQLKNLRRATLTELRAYLDRHPEVVAAAARVHSQRPPEWTPPSVAGTVLILLQRAAEGLGEPEWPDMFYEGWRTGAFLETGNPILVLRKLVATRRMIGDDTVTTRDRRLAPVPDEIAAYACRAWNHWVSGSKVTRLILPQGGLSNQNFPWPEGYKKWRGRPAAR